MTNAWTHGKLTGALLLLVCLPSTASACAIAFGAGARPAPAPRAFDDLEHTGQRDHKDMGFRPPGITPGMSVVVGGERIDAGTLPPPPIPIAPSL